ncbi:MAG: ribosomal protein S18-alanine N-acetyltransferase [Cyanobacteriota bacterium]|nr:ribosomal protein S18-alanine N-acetyltransferase [Cyanobacteriota bacterium]
MRVDFPISPHISSLADRSPGAPDGIVRLGVDDEADCLLLDRLALGGLWTAEQWERELSEAQRPVLGWRQGRRLLAVASAWIVVDELQITAVAVDPEHRRQGLARQLLEAMLRLGREAGAGRATLEVSSANKAAQALYAGLGFQEVAVRRGYYRNGDDALIQWRKL